MDCITSIQKAIEYMEQHLLEDINYEDVARQVYMSSYHFHRTFRMITGVSANEYIRNRRLSIAGQELCMSEIKVIDMAYKCGYETPESFTKAFQRFHGISPSVAKRSGMPLKLYNRLILKLIVEGGNMVDYKIIEREPFQVLAKVEEFENEIVNVPGNQEIPRFWERCGKEGVFGVLRQHADTYDVYGICGNISKGSNTFQYGVGMLYNGNHAPSGYQIFKVKPTLWAVFPCIGGDGACIETTWDRIFKEFLPGSEYDMLDEVDFELYPEESDGKLFCEIWIPVVKRQ